MPLYVINTSSGKYQWKTPDNNMSVPGVPSTFTAGQAATTSIPFTWTLNGGETSIQIRGSLSGKDSWTAYPLFPGDATSGIITGLTENTSYDFQVRAINDSGASDWSGTVTQSTIKANISSGDTLATVNLGVGAATFLQVFKQGTVQSAAKIGGLPTQTDVKTRWPDGSVRTAVLTTNVTSQTNYDIKASDPVSGMFSPTAPDVSVEFVTGTNWQVLGSYSITSGTLSVSLDDSTSGYVVADAIRIDNGTNNDPNAIIIDDKDSGFSKVGSWTSGPVGYISGSWFVLGSGTGNNKATWTKAGLASGTYRISATWNPYSNHSTAVPYTVKDGVNTKATVSVNQIPNPSSFVSGDLYVARLPKAPSSDLWLDGPLVKEWRCEVKPVKNGGQAHPCLNVIFDIRSYASGGHKADITVENILVNSSPTDYSVDIKNGTDIIYHHDTLTHHRLTRWRKYFFINGMAKSSVIPDFEPAHVSKTLPRYLNLDSGAIYTQTDGDPAFDILGWRKLDPNQSNVGGRPEIAPAVCGWEANYVIHKNPVMQAYTLGDGDSAAHWPIHVRNADGTLPNIDDNPDFYMGDVGGSSSPLVPDLAHKPSLAFLPYLITGDRFYVDEMAYDGYYAIAAAWPGFSQNIRHGNQGLISNVIYAGVQNLKQGILQGIQIRGIAWGLRLMAQAAACLPDGDRRKAYLKDKLKNNLDWFDGLADAHNAPLGTYLESPNPYNPYANYSTWQMDFVCFSIGHAHDLGVVSGTSGLKMRDKIARFDLEVFTNPKIPEVYRAVDYWRVGALPGNDTITYFKTWEEALPYNPTNLSLSGYYGVNMRLSLMVAEQAGYKGATEALAYLYQKIGVDIQDQNKTDLQLRPEWALAEVVGPYYNPNA